jgi:hypothetical protein
VQEIKSNQLCEWKNLSHDSDSFCTAVAEEKRHSHLDILGTKQKPEKTRPGLVGAEELSSKDAFDDGSLSDACDVDCVLESLFDSLYAGMLDDDYRCLSSK